MTQPNGQLDYAPPRPALVAWAVFVAAALTLCWPMFLGQFLGGPHSDMYRAGFSFRQFGADYFRQYGSIPLWNPYIYAGLPFVGAAHGDIFYPTAWLRLFLPTDVAINLGFAIHIVIAGGAMYGLLRTIKVGWAGALVGGICYELTGIVISLVHPGHDGKLFVSALAPLLLTGIVFAVRDRRILGYAIVALSTGLALQGHPQTGYYLVIAGGVWGLFWVFGAEGPKGTDRYRVIASAVGAVVLGAGLYAIYALPMAQYVPFSPRAAGGPNTGWEHAISFSLPLNELPGILLPQLFGQINPMYFGANGIRFHSEYLGPVTLILAIVGLGGAERRTVRNACLTLAILFLLVSLGGSTPFFRLWYAIMPMSGKLRAPGQAFFVVALAVSVFAGIGAERLVRLAGSPRRILIAGGVIAAIGLLAAVGALELVAEDIGRTSPVQGAAERAIANRSALELDGIRLVVVTLAGCAVLWLVGKGKLRQPLAIAAIAVVAGADLWIVGKRYWFFSPPASITYGNDEITDRLRTVPKPYRVWQPEGRYGGASAYPDSWLMSHDIPTLFGYHGNEIRYFDELLGGKQDWANQANPNFLKLYGIRFLIANQRLSPPGFHLALGPIKSIHTDSTYLYETDTVPPYARVLAGAAKVPEDQLVPTLADPRFPVERLVLYPDTASVTPADLGGQVPPPSVLSATVADWRPGHFSVAIHGTSNATEYLVVAENWYLDWQATIDGKPATVLRGQGALLSVALSAGAKEVVFDYRSRAYERGRTISALSAVGVLLLFSWPLIRRRRRDA